MKLIYPIVYKYPTPRPVKSDSYGPIKIENSAKRTTGYHLEGI
jgi:hypothetical protein